MANDPDYFWRGLMAGLVMMSVGIIYETRDSPCIYQHDWLVDSFSHNSEKRTCRAMFDEGNERILTQQQQTKLLTDEVQDLKSQLAQRGEYPRATDPQINDVSQLSERLPEPDDSQNGD